MDEKFLDINQGKYIKIFFEGIIFRGKVIKKITENRPQNRG